MRSPVRSLTAALIAVGSIATCSVDKTGLGSATGGAVAGRGGTSGVAGASGGGVLGTGVAGMGVAGTGGSGGGSGGTGPGTGGLAGTAAVGGSAGTSDIAGQGGGGAAGTGTAGMGGAGGTTDSCQACASCFRCGAQGSCEPTPNARWTVICQSAVIAAMKPNGMTWDAPPPATSGTAPDTFCELTIDNDHTSETAVVTDSLTPTWNQPVNPSGGQNVTASLLMAEQSRWTIAIIDRDIQPPGSTEPVCQMMPRLTAGDLQRGMVSLMSGSCTQLNLGLACDEN